MIAVDTALLVHAHRADSPHHEAALEALNGLAGRTATWAIPGPSLHEFLKTITDETQWQPPTPTSVAAATVEALASTDNLTLIGETPHHLEILAGLMRESGAHGAGMQSARIAAICLGNGIKELWTADRDFSWFPELHTVNPLTNQNR